MAIATIFELKDQLSFTYDFGAEDDALLTRLLAAAEDHVERLLGFKVEDSYGGTGQDPVPPSLSQAVLMLAAFWYENREAGGEVTIKEMPYAVREIVLEYREFTF